MNSRWLAAAASAIAGRIASWIAIAALLATAPLTSPRAAHAQPQDSGHTYFCQVAQPMVARDDRRVEIHDVTYALKLFVPVPGVEIQYTTYPGPVPIQSDYKSDTVGMSNVANLNAANLLGIGIRIESRPRGTWNAMPDSAVVSKAAERPRQRFYVDELRVDVDLGGVNRQRLRAGDPRATREELARFDALIDATIECILENARRSTPPIRKIKINVVGWERYHHWADTYVVKTSPERKQFRY